MVRITRSSSTTENLEDEESELVTDVAEEIGSKKITSDLNFAITVFIQKGFYTSFHIFHLFLVQVNNWNLKNCTWFDILRTILVVCSG